MIRIAIFGSGGGTNAQCIIDHFRSSGRIMVGLVLSDKPGAFILKRAESAGIPRLPLRKDQIGDGTALMKILQDHGIGFIVLAGYLRLIPAEVIEGFRNRIVNIHPALLPDFGGKGMFGDHVHRAVIDAGRKESGITIHYVNEHYDKGDVIFQARCPVLPDDSPESLAARIHHLEHRHYPVIIEQVIGGLR